MIIWETHNRNIALYLLYCEVIELYTIEIERNNKTIHTESFIPKELPSKRVLRRGSYTYDMNIKDLEIFCKRMNNILKRLNLKI